ncbi:MULTISPECIES: hypothetical protein [unclassified Acinetobacter]|uniref:hypothetical protein n=1 Tax=unclassified Acinetobacter TaxID=196816 RepID=UPI00293471BD|nr:MULTISPECIES: hypothetical protein [unclassified Acinetobacter]WOE30405.1 hypothetical protein QSG84_08255 [Acinetobacter sp. SAAs470]WOE38596.1 hypothetical protein QSG86_01920 [Acinetobacter sp. SAAs474]
MKDFLLNFTRIVEANPQIYWSIILSIALCLILFVIEAVHVQHILEILTTSDQTRLKQAIDPITQRYTWARIVIVIGAVIWSNYAYLETKKKLGLSAAK